ncbi:hypothetical protein BH23ACT9_BH23ACT9_06470 [soil metagenome]
MSTTAPPRPPVRPDASAAAAAPPPGVPVRRPPVVSDDVLTLALALLLLAAILPLRDVFIGSEWIRPVAGGVLLAVGIGWGARRLDVGPVTHLVMTGVSLLVFVTIAFLPGTAIAGVIPTTGTLGALRELFIRGLELVELRPSPTFAEAGLLLLAVTGTWVVAYLADGMLFVLRSPLNAVACALVLWSVPLAVAPQTTSVGLAAVAILGAGGVLLLLGSAITASTFGIQVAVPGTDGRPRTAPVVPLPGVVVGTAAIVTGLLLASLLPGFGGDPLYEARGGSGTTITTNPIVDIRSRLVATDSGPVLRVASPRPMYMRTTALDRYDADEQWTTGTISGNRVTGVVDTPPAGPVERVDVTVEIRPSIESGAVLAPAPFQPVEVSGPKADVLRYDPASATLTVPGDAVLTSGDTYTVGAAIAQPSVEALRAVGMPTAGSVFTDLPPNVPSEVVALARQIVNDAQAQTMFDAALAVQDHLRGWQYSTVPEPGLGATAMLRFIDAQEGYCEQYAGTMAVMLRTLGIPSRLAVGYTPGDLTADGIWEVTNANAHAWVEVDFGDLGWIAFEPTPRTDGNVLVTSPDAVLPTQTQAQAEGLPQPATPADPGQAPLPVETAQPPPFEDLGGPDGTGAGPGEAADGGVPGWLLLLALLGLLGGASTLLVRRAGAPDVSLPAPVRIDRARRRVELTGGALGRRRHPSETDEEYFVRIADGTAAGWNLARPSTRAVYAPAVTDLEAAAAEQAAQAMVTRLLAGHTRRRRAAVAVRTAVGTIRER